jgi:hypothetical protein
MTGKAAACGSPALERRLSRVARIEGDLAVLKWMTGTTLAGVVALVIKTFFA